MNRKTIKNESFAIVIDDEKSISKHFAKLLTKGNLPTLTAPNKTVRLTSYLESFSPEELKQLVLIIADQQYSTGAIGPFLQKVKMLNPESLILEKSGFPTRKIYEYSDTVIFDILRFTKILEKIGPNSLTIAMLLYKIKNYLIEEFYYAQLCDPNSEINQGKNLENRNYFEAKEKLMQHPLYKELLIKIGYTPKSFARKLVKLSQYEQFTVLHHCWNAFMMLKNNTDINGTLTYTRLLMLLNTYE